MEKVERRYSTAPGWEFIKKYTIYCMPKHTRICEYCKKEYDSYNTKQRFCTKQCVGLQKKTERIIKPCLHCGILICTTPKKEERKKFCSQHCLYEYMSIERQQSEREIVVCVCGKSFKRPSVAVKLQRFCSLKCGNKNRTRTYKPTEAHKKAVSESRRAAWIRGDYEHVDCLGRCKWYTYKTIEGNDIRLQGRWEVEFAKWLENQKKTFTAHRGVVYYVDDLNVTRAYLPDFFVNEWNAYVDIKAYYFFAKSRRKFELLFQQNPDLKLLLLLEPELNKIGLPNIPERVEMQDPILSYTRSLLPVEFR
jgi:hypothetical protein